MEWCQHAVCCGVSSRLGPRSDTGACWPDKFVCIRAYRPAAAIFHAVGKTMLDHCVCRSKRHTKTSFYLYTMPGLPAESQSVVGGPPAAKANQIGRA